MLKMKGQDMANANLHKAKDALRTDAIHRHGGWINGKEKHMRILIRKKVGA